MMQGESLEARPTMVFALHATPQNDFARAIKPGDAAAVLTQINDTWSYKLAEAA